MSPQIWYVNMMEMTLEKLPMSNFFSSGMGPLTPLSKTFAEHCDRKKNEEKYHLSGLYKKNKTGVK